MPSCLLAITGANELGGGIAVTNQLLMDALLEKGFCLTVHSLCESKGSTGRYPKCVQYRAFANKKLPFVQKTWLELIRNSPSFIYCDHVNLAAAMVPFSLSGRTPVLVRLHGTEVFPGNLKLVGKLGLFGSSYRIASRYTEKLIRKTYPYLQVEPSDLALPKASEHLPEPSGMEHPVHLCSVVGLNEPLGDQFILHVGRMASSERYKGQDILIDTMSEVLARCPQAQLVLAGSGDDYERLLSKAAAKPCNVASRIFLPGFVNEAILQTLYQSCFAFAMPSRGEGFGLVYLEAMRWGKACLASKSDAAPFVIEEGITGVLVEDPTSSGQVASALIKMLEAPEETKRMGRAGRVRFTSEFSFARYNNSLTDTLLKLGVLRPTQCRDIVERP